MTEFTSESDRSCRCFVRRLKAKLSIVRFIGRVVWFLLRPGMCDLSLYPRTPQGFVEFFYFHSIW